MVQRTKASISVACPAFLLYTRAHEEKDFQTRDEEKPIRVVKPGNQAGVIR
jgi:hypothetical protein